MEEVATAMPTSEMLSAEQRVVLEGISWETYERLLAENNPGRATRFTYSEGALEVVVRSRRHERPNRILAAIAETVAYALRLAIEPVGSMTYKRRSLQKGFEPDSSYYIRNAAELAAREGDIDSEVDPPPDLVI